MPKLAYPLADLFNEIGLTESIRVMEEAAHVEPLARRFIDWWEDHPRQHTAFHAARAVQQMNLDLIGFKNMLVRYYQLHQRCLAKIRQAARIPNLTDVSMDAATEPANRDERLPHLQTSGVLDSPKAAVNIENTLAIQNNVTQLPSFESDILQIEEKLRGQLPAATTEFIDAEVVTEREKEKEYAAR